MPIHDEAAALLALARALREGLEALEAPEATPALLDLKRIKEWLEAVKRRGEAEASGLKLGLGAPARFRRVR